MAIIIISDKVNRSGYRVNVAGGRLENYSKNPILLFMHNRASHDWMNRPKEDERLPVGRLENLRVEGGSLVADDPIWDDNDPFAKTLKSKYEGGFMSAFSAGLIPMTVSDAPEWLVKGQTRSTIVEWELLEVSIVDIPKDGNAVRLSMAEGDSLDTLVPKINQSQSSNQPEMDLKKIALKLKLGENATEADVLSAIETLAAEADGHRKARRDALLKQGKDSGVITQANEKHWMTVIEQSLDSAEALIANFQPVPPAEGEDKPPTAAELLKLAADKNVGAAAGKKANRDDWGFDKWSKEDPKGLNEMRLKEPAKYEKLAQEYNPD